MEITNTIEFKQQYFAAHYGQEIVKWEEKTDLQDCDYIAVRDCDTPDYLELKALSDITDEDAIEVAKIFDLNHLGNDNTKIMLIKDILQTNWETHGNRRLWMEVVDFLRSKSCAISYRGVPVETLIEWGYCKLKTK